jgi:quercetin dioxygenase-like cupin family protein
MSDVFPEPILDLPMADIPLEGVSAYLSQSTGHQILFMEFDRDVEFSEHSHESQWAVVLEGKIELVVEGVRRFYSKGDRFFIPKDARHSARIYAGYAAITFFDEEGRYQPK